MDKIRQEIRWEVDKLTSSQRLDLNLEKGRLRDEVARVETKASCCANAPLALASHRLCKCAQWVLAHALQVAEADVRAANRVTDAEMKAEKAMSVLRTALETSKADTIKYFIATTVSLVAAAVAVARLYL